MRELHFKDFLDDAAIGIDIPKTLKQVQKDIDKKIETEVKEYQVEGEYRELRDLYDGYCDSNKNGRDDYGKEVKLLFKFISKLGNYLNNISLEFAYKQLSCILGKSSRFFAKDFSSNDLLSQDDTIGRVRYSLFTDDKKKIDASKMYFFPLMGIDMLQIRW